MKAFITGINGFLGRHLERAFTAAGWNVAGSTSQASRVRPGVVLLRHGMPVDGRLLSGCAVVLHCAHDFSPGAHDRNVTTIVATVTAAQAAGVPRQVFISSLSARADATSEYGRTKFDAEAALRAVPGVSIARPGTIIGEGGVFGRLVGVVRRFPVVPLLAGGRRPMQLVGVHDLTHALVRLAGEAAPEREYNLYYASQPPLRDVVRAIEHAERLRRLHVSVPGRPLLVAIRALEAMGLKPPLNTENLRGYFAEPAQIHPPCWGTLGPVSTKPLPEILRESLS